MQVCRSSERFRQIAGICLILCGHNMNHSRPALVDELQCGHSVKTKALRFRVLLTMPAHEPGDRKAFSASHVLQRHKHKTIHLCGLHCYSTTHT